uniref:Cytochrome c oxidase assembly protein COX16 homolog, mitochondrial n=1 Tax=Equus caballus TaxID=9796 RepID=A0A9L0S1Z2_HORSE
AAEVGEAALGAFGGLSERVGEFTHVSTRGDARPAQEQDPSLRSPHVGECGEEKRGGGVPEGVGPLVWLERNCGDFVIPAAGTSSLGCKGLALLIVGGSFGLREFSQIRYDAVKIKIDPELEKKLKMNKISLESEYEKIKDSAFDDWKNIRGPRPWEDPDFLQGRNPEILKTKTT